MEPDPERKPRSAENFLNTNRRMAWFDGQRDIKIDGVDAIDRDFAVHLRKSAIPGAAALVQLFVLDRNHPEFGKVLAVHVEHKPILNTNIGFKLLGAFDFL